MLKKWMLPLLTLALLVTACSTNTAGPNEVQSDESPLVIGLEADAATLLANTDVNYVTDVQIRNIYDPLIDRDEKGNFVPVLATEWKNVNDLTWEITLREGIKFHNGEEFNADVVKYNIDYILDEKNKSFYRSRWQNVKEVKSVSPYKVQVMTSQPFPTLMQRIAEDLLIMPPKYIKEVGIEQAATQPIGTGAYKFSKWIRDDSLELVAHDEYWKGKPSIQKVVFKYIPEFSTRLSAFLSGEIHVIKNLPVDSVSTVKEKQNVTIRGVPSARINYIALNTFHDGPLKDKKVRQALNYAVNVDELLSTVLNGHGTKMTGPLANNNSEHTPTTDYGYDPQKAIQLLKEAGYEPSQLQLQLDTPNGRYPMDSHVSQAIASQLQKIGIKVSVQVNEWGNHLTKIRQREMKDMYLLGWGPVFDAQGTIENLFTEKAPYSGFHDPQVEEQILKALPIIHPEERKKSFDALQNKLVEEAAWIPLWQQEDLYGVVEQLDFIPRSDEKILAFEMKWSQ